MTPKERALDAAVQLEKARDELNAGLAEKGLLRPPGESCDPPNRSDGTLLKATTETYPALINGAGWVLIIYCHDEHWAMNRLHGRATTYTSPKPKYSIPRAVLTMARKLVREGRLSAILVDISRCAIQPDRLDQIQTVRLYRDGAEIGEYELGHSRRGNGPADAQVLTWIERTMARAPAGGQ